MYTKSPKKLLMMNILDILKKYTDENHRLSQKEIISILQEEYDMYAERKAVKRNLLNLIDFGYDIEYSESIRKNCRGEEEVVFTDWYLVHAFSDSELCFLINSLLFSKSVSHNQCKRLIEKIAKLSNVYFKSKIGYVHSFLKDKSEYGQIFYTIEILNEAIQKRKKVSFFYNEYRLDKQLHKRENSHGEPRIYRVTPYQIASANGRSYLIGNHDGYDNLSNYRLDRISDIQLLDEQRKPMETINGLGHLNDVATYMKEHVYLFSGERSIVTFQAPKYLVSDLIDWFGQGICFLEETSEEVTVKVMADLEAMRRWAFQYSPHIRVKKPKKLVKKIQEDIKKASEQYC